MNRYMESDSGLILIQSEVEMDFQANSHVWCWWYTEIIYFLTEWGKKTKEKKKKIQIMSSQLTEGRIDSAIHCILIRFTFV